MPRRIVLTLAPLLVVAALVLAGRPALAQETALYAAPALDIAALQIERQVLPPAIRSCLDLESEEVRLAQEPVSIDAPGRSGRPDLCLLYREYDDIYHVVMVPIDSAEHFRAAKDAAAGMLTGAGFDLCAIGGWTSYGGSADGLTLDDLLSVPTVCAPRVRSLAADGQITAVFAEVRDAVMEVALLTAQQMAWQPNRALTVLAMMDPELTVDIYRRSISSLPPAEMERRARAGRSVAGADSFAGPRIFLNFVGTPAAAEQRGQPLALEARFEATVFIAHEYTHFVQAGIGGSNSIFPLWFLEGQAVYQEERNGGIRPFHREEATRLQRIDRGPRLAELSDRDDWFDLEERAGSDAVYSRAFAAVALLVERHGFDATVQLLRDNKHGSIDRFNSLLAALTGQDLEGFDGALNAWLLGPATTGVPPPTIAPPNARYAGADAANRIRIEFTISANGRVAVGALMITAPISCGNGFLPAGGRLTFENPIRPDGGFADSVPAGQALLTLDVRIQGATAEGAFTYTNPNSGCDTGRIAFTARMTP